MNFEFDLSCLSRDELEEECIKLQSICKQFRDASEDDAQRIHELKLNLDRVTAAENFLKEELEQLTATTTNTKDLTKNAKLQSDNDELRRNYHTLNVEYTKLHEGYQAMVEEKIELERKLDKLNTDCERNDEADIKAANEKLSERLNAMEQENLELLQKLEEQRADQIQHTMALAAKDKKIELMQDEVACLEENMRYKRDELDEKSRMLESAQEQLYEANTKISQLTSSPENQERKGNSLFAEVDDQRQVMKQILAAQNKNYKEMKKVYNESQYEIRRLKLENNNVYEELKTCSSLFRGADRTYQDKLNGRIRQLLKENEELEQKLKWTEMKLKDLASNSGVTWLNSMFNFCKQETDEIKKQLKSVRIENSSLEEQLRNKSQEMTRWRYEALQTRCLLADRENLLTDHKISFKPRNTREYRLTESHIRTAIPCITSPDKEKATKNENCGIGVAAKNEIKTEPNTFQSPKADEAIFTVNDNRDCHNENHDVSLDKITLNSIIPKTESCDLKAFQNPQQQQPKANNLQPQIKSVVNPNLEPLVEKNSIESTPEPQLQSILCKQRNIFSEVPKKKARFAEKENSIINISTSPDCSAVLKDDSITTNNTEEHNKSGKVTKAIRTKSNVLVRHINVSSKPK